MIRQLIAAIATVLAFNAFAAVDVNKANQAELESIKGIGPAMSTKILAERQKGEFKNWTDLVERVKGVGPGNAGRFSEAGLTVGASGYGGAVAKADAGDKPMAKPAKAAKPARTASPEVAATAK